MKWGLFLISMGALIMGISGDPAQGETQMGLLICGAGLFGIGLVITVSSSKKEKKKKAEKQLEMEAEQFRLEQEEKRKIAGEKKQIENVEKSRAKSNAKKGEQ